jgi:hypothetical protein
MAQLALSSLWLRWASAARPVDCCVGQLRPLAHQHLTHAPLCVQCGVALQ